MKSSRDGSSMRNETAKTLCVGMEPGGIGARLHLTGDRLILKDGVAGAEERMKAVLEEILKEGVSLRVESVTPGTVQVGWTHIGPGEDAYLEAVAERFRSFGWTAFVANGRKEEIWKRLYALPVKAELRMEIAPVVPHLGEKALAELESILEDAEKAILETDT